MRLVSSQYFRAGVVIVVRHPNGREVLAFEREDIRGSWQLPQGGMHRGEEPLAAAWRATHCIRVPQSEPASYCCVSSLIDRTAGSRASSFRNSR